MVVDMNMIKRIFRLLLKILKWTLLIVIGLGILSALYNLTLPKESKTVEQLSENQKFYIAEALNLQESMGNNVWPGWGDAFIPVTVYNEEYAFLIGYPDPPAGWLKMPSGEFRGAEWEMVTSDDFFGEAYYRQSLPNPASTPENFTVMVGDRWVASMQTKEYAAIRFYNGFRKELPPVLDAVFPYKIFWNILMGPAEKYITGLAHEAFHAFQGIQATQRFAEAERVAGLERDYPWSDDENAIGWKKEINLLIESYQAESKESTLQLASQFLDQRDRRREEANLSPEMIHYEQNREWLEGLAKYAELTIGMEASQDNNYEKAKEVNNISGFKNYRNYAKYYKQQIEEVRRSATRKSENRFYYTGMLQAVMLDRLMPEWKKEAFEDDVYLEQLLGEVLN